MPLPELRKQVEKYKEEDGSVSFESLLYIADYFGVSFSSCVFRVAYSIHAVSGDTSAANLEKRIKSFSPEHIRKEKGLSYENLYADMIDSLKDSFSFTTTNKRSIWSVYLLFHFPQSVGRLEIVAA